MNPLKIATNSKVANSTPMMPDNHLNHPYMQAKAAAQSIAHNFNPSPNSPDNYEKSMNKAYQSTKTYGVGWK